MNKKTLIPTLLGIFSVFFITSNSFATELHIDQIEINTSSPPISGNAQWQDLGNISQLGSISLVQLRMNKVSATPVIGYVTFECSSPFFASQVYVPNVTSISSTSTISWTP